MKAIFRMSDILFLSRYSFEPFFLFLTFFPEKAFDVEKNKRKMQSKEKLT